MFLAVKFNAHASVAKQYIKSQKVAILILAEQNGKLWYNIIYTAYMLHKLIQSISWPADGTLSEQETVNVDTNLWLADSMAALNLR